MSQENVEAFERGVEAFNNGDVEALIEEADPGVEFYDVFGRMLGGEERMYRGHQGVRDLFDDLLGAFAETHSEYLEIRDLGDRTIAIGRLRAVGKESGAEIESPIGTIAQWKNGKVTRIRTYLDPEEALEAAGL
jgi:ketosteroid isomerase-like protein